MMQIYRINFVIAKKSGEEISPNLCGIEFVQYRNKSFIGAARQVPRTGGGFRGWVTHGLLKEKGFASEPLLLLVNQLVVLRAEAWENYAVTVATLGNNLKYIYLWSRIAQKHISFHSRQFEILTELYTLGL